MLRSPHVWKRLTWIACTLIFVFGVDRFVDGTDDWKRPINEPSADGAYYYAYLPSLFLDGDLDFTNEYRVTKNWYRLGPTKTGMPGNVFGIGPAVYQAPAFLVGHAIAIAKGQRRDGFSPWETGLVLVSSIGFTLGACVLASRLVRRRVGDGPASVLGPIVAMFAGSAWYYAVRQPGYAHPFAMFAAVWLIERWDASYEAAPRSAKTWLHLGVAMGAAMLARPQLVLWGIVLVAAVIDDVRKRGDVPLKTLALRWALAGAATVLVFSPQLVAWKILYGAWWVVPQGEGFMRWDDPALLETLFSSRNGLFPWAPLYLPLLAGLAFVTSARGRLAAVLVAGLVLQAWANGAVWDWWAGGSFGGRRFDSAFVLFALGASALLHRGFALCARAFRERRPVVIASASGAAIAMLAALWVTRAQYVLARETSVTSARIFGGQPPSEVYLKKVRGLPSQLAARLSLLVSWPVRAVFAWRNDTEISAYDRLVGVHYLGETYPGLNAAPDRVTEVISFKQLGEPRFRNLRTAGPGAATMTRASARIFVGLNRSDSLRIQLPVQASGFVRVSFDGEVHIDRVLVGSAVLELVVRDPARGVHWLDLAASPGTRLQEPMLVAE